MKDASLFDSLTGAYTRATFREKLSEQVERSQRESTSCSLLFFDLDHFKSINDAFGHARGDEALAEVAQRVRETTRESDLFFRYGGDEFVLVLPSTTKEEAVQLASRLLDRIRANPIGGETAITLSISVGVATFPEDTAAENSLFEKADARNYEAKRRGRARVIFEESSAVPELPFAEISRIIERDEMFEIAQNFLNATVQGHRGILSVAGVSGVGRSRFLTEVEKRARLQGFEVIALRGSPRLKNRPYSALAHLGNIAFTSPERVGFEELDSVLQQHLSDLGTDRLLISVDDLPELDWGTLDLLRQLISQSAIPVLGIAYVSDPDSARVMVPFWSPVSEHVTLYPLTGNGLRIWLRVLMQWEAPEDFVQWLEHETCGLPHEVERLIKHLLKHDALVKLDSGWRLQDEYMTIGTQGIRSWQKRISPNNLPAALTSFIGRENVLKDARGLLASTRLLTVVGPGGMGKTRLTLQVAKEVFNSFKDGAWLIELAPVSDPSLVLYTIASTLGVREEHSRPLIETLSTWLSNKEFLLILDNCEHLVDLCAQFAHHVLSRSPNVRILASSREALDIVGELVYRMPALETPSLQTNFSVEQLNSFAAARLFVERATFAEFTFRVGESDAPLIAQICRQLDGIPLAIELAAARLRSLTLEEIASGLNDCFNLLTKGNRAALPRHQTLRALIDWSYDMLSEAERTLLRRLSVFAGGWTLEATVQICVQAESGNAELSEASNLLQRLVDKSLVNLDERFGEPRYSMLETIRQYAHERLIDLNEVEQVRDQHLNYFLTLTERMEPMLFGAQREAWVPRFEIEHDNLRTALDYACKHHFETALWLSGMLGSFWYFGDHLNEGHAWFLRVLALDRASTSNKVLAKALSSAGMVSSNLGYNEEALAWLEHSVAIWLALGEKRHLAETLFWLAYALMQFGRDDQVCALFEKHEVVLRTSADPVILGWSLSYWARALENARADFVGAKRFHDEAVELGHVLQDTNILGSAFMNLGYWATKQGNYQAGYQYHAESLIWRRRNGARLRIAISLHNMADMLSMQGEFQKAQPLYEESLELSRALGDQAFIAWTAYRLGYVTVHMQEYERARELFAESSKLYRVQDEQELLTSCIAGCAELQRAQGRFGLAARILGFISAHPQAENRRFLSEIDLVEYERSLAAVRTQLNASEFDLAWDEGQQLTIDEAIELALS